MIWHGTWKRLAVWGVAVSLAGCSSDLLTEATEDIDSVYTQMVATPPDVQGKPLGPRELLASAQIRGPDFLGARLNEAGARLQLDERKAQRAPRFSLSLRRQASVQGSGFAVGGSDASIAMNWDVATALLYTGDAKILQLVEDYLPVQASLARRQATARLFEAYFQHEEALLVQRNLQSEIRLAKCQSEAARVELELGNISPAEMLAGRQVVSALQQQAAVAERSVQALRREVLYRAGIAETAELIAGDNPLEAVSQAPANLSQEACYARSGNALRDRLLLEGAAGTLRLAKLQRFGRFDVLLPTDVSSGRGFNLNLLISVLVPLVDQRDGTRTIQRARQSLLEIALAADQNRRSFDLQLSEAEFARAQASTKQREARNALAQTTSDTLPSCEASHQQEQARIEMRRAAIDLQKAEMALALLCAGTDETAEMVFEANQQILEIAAPKSERGM